ncbi:hypothetical protein M758_2G077800 [Ceratodon purpureus]|nr:hypothetical protein M758_2G077800 [Ceratodon purpureus]
MIQHLLLKLLTSDNDPIQNCSLLALHSVQQTKQTELHISSSFTLVSSISTH